MKRKVKVKKLFDIHGREIISYIRQNSVQNSEKFIKEVIQITDEIIANPKAYPPEPNLHTINNLYRFALVMKSWKIVFKVTNELLVFLSIIHTARHPKEIKNLRTKNYD